MDYENFKEQFIEQLQEELYGKGVEARFDTKAVEKLNNEGYDAVTVTPTDSNIGVTLNVEAFHKAYEDGASMNEVISRASVSSPNISPYDSFKFVCFSYATSQKFVYKKFIRIKYPNTKKGPFLRLISEEKSSFYMFFYL